MTEFSKLLYYSCYEIGHTWDADCSVGIFDGFISTVLGSSKIYAVVYMLTALLKWKKISKAMAIDLFQNYIRSVCFLTVNGAAFIAFVCFYRKLFGHTNFLSAAFLPSFTASVLAILVERPNRRNMLALYVTNVASACLWNVAVARNYVTPIKNGEVLIFMVGMAMISYYKSTEGSPPLIKSLFKFLIGEKSESKNIINSNKSEEILISSNTKRRISPRSCLQQMPKIFQIFATGFVRGYGARVAIRLISLFGRVPFQPSVLKNILAEKHAFHAGLFLATFSCTFKTVSWITLMYRKAPSPANDCLAGFLAGMTMLWFPSSTIALYTFWKGLEIVYTNLAKDGYVPIVPGGIEIIYCLSTAYLFQVAVFEPQNLKLSYWKFLHNLTEGRMSEYNRKVLDVYGLGSGLTQTWPSYREVDRLSHKFRRDFAHEFKNAAK